MACGATLKRSVEFDALLSPQSQSPKRRRCMPLTGPGAGAPSPQKYLKSEPAAFGGESSSAHRLTPEQIFQNIKQEYNRFQWRRQLEGSFNQSETNSSAEGSPNTLLLNAPSSPGFVLSQRKLTNFKSDDNQKALDQKNTEATRAGTLSKKDQPLFTLRQVGIICERLLKDHESKIREEYEQVLNTKLAEQYDAFVKFTHDQIMRRYGERPASYVS
ncbi:akirin-1 isoform X1 [Scyliorhinus torazame]|uniref:akirin-1 isoform X1 n=1 Tax=Scyliorhinus torazame TaxID=75743 RepID=UPI003B58D61C